MKIKFTIKIDKLQVEEKILEGFEFNTDTECSEAEYFALVKNINFRDLAEQFAQFVQVGRNL